MSVAVGRGSTSAKTPTVPVPRVVGLRYDAIARIGAARLCAELEFADRGPDERIVSQDPAGRSRQTLYGMVKLRSGPLDLPGGLSLYALRLDGGDTSIASRTR